MTQENFIPPKVDTSYKDELIKKIKEARSVYAAVDGACSQVSGVLMGIDICLFIIDPTYDKSKSSGYNMH